MEAHPTVAHLVAGAVSTLCGWRSISRRMPPGVRTATDFFEGGGGIDDTVMQDQGDKGDIQCAVGDGEGFNKRPGGDQRVASGLVLLMRRSGRF